ncbi:biotin-dependent carboxyltransferase family protein [Aestuariibius insulae]|uniref:5-oxoprolinase subunit C family protein n=1 Tax=Aestuariibius insulae TaxID=2058287 RepID=UPI00345EACB3
MTAHLTLTKAGPGATLQDRGRPSQLAGGVSRGGAVDPLALLEGALLLGQDTDAAAIELATTPITLRTGQHPAIIALSGAPMRTDLAWNATHFLPPETELTLQPGRDGIYSYLHIAGGFRTDLVLGSRSIHLKAGIGQPLQAEDRLPYDPKTNATADLVLNTNRPDQNAPIRILSSVQTALFAKEERVRFEATRFTPDPRSTRSALRLSHDTKGFEANGQLDILSEATLPGDIQITGDGTAYVLMPDCQTTGGYPRIAAVIPTDMPRLVQTPPGKPLTFRFVSREEALTLHRTEMARRKTLPKQIGPRLRDPRDIPDLLSYQLISGITAGREEP